MLLIYACKDQDQMSLKIIARQPYMYSYSFKVSLHRPTIILKIDKPCFCHTNDNIKEIPVQIKYQAWLAQSDSSQVHAQTQNVNID